jgi:hypothetical protein
MGIRFAVAMGATLVLAVSSVWAQATPVPPPALCDNLTPPGVPVPCYKVYVSALTRIDAPPAPTPTPQPLHPYDGIWAGTTSQGFNFTLVVQQSGVASIETEIDIANCGPEFTIEFNPPLRLTGNGFSARTSFDGVTLTIAGSLDSTGAASGTITGSSSNRQCRGPINATWSATRRP